MKGSGVGVALAAIEGALPPNWVAASGDFQSNGIAVSRDRRSPCPIQPATSASKIGSIRQDFPSGRRCVNVAVFTGNHHSL